MNTHQRMSKRQRIVQKRAGLTPAERLFLWCMLGLSVLAFVVLRPGSVDVLQGAFWLHLWAACFALLGPRVLGLCALILCMLLLITFVGVIQSFGARKPTRKTSVRVSNSKRYKRRGWR